MTWPPLERVGGLRIVAPMPRKHALWKAVNAQLKATGCATRLKATDDFEARAKLKGASSELVAVYQPREGRIPGQLRIELVIEGRAVPTAVANFLCEEERLMREVKQKLTFEHALAPDLPPECGEATIRIEAEVVSPHGEALIERLAPWAAGTVRSLLWLHQEIAPKRTR